MIKYGKTKVNFGGHFTFENIKTCEASLIYFLLYSGYISPFKNKICKISNYEVQSYFFKNIIEAWLKKNIPEFDISLILTSFEETLKYGNEFEKQFLQNMIYKDYDESYFQTLVAIPFIYRSEIQPKYKIYIEDQNVKNTKIDVLLTPKKGDSNSVFLLEVRQTKTHENINTMIEDALFQAFDKKHVYFLLEEAKQPKNKHWEKVYIRAVVFSPNDLKTKWKIIIKEIAFSKEKLQAACQKFENFKQANQEIKEERIKSLLSDLDSISEYPIKTS